MPHLLELFSGTGSMGAAFRDAGFQVTSVDLRADFNPDICCDVFDFQVGMLEGRPVDVIWSSPPAPITFALERGLKLPGMYLGAMRLFRRYLI